MREHSGRWVESLDQQIIEAKAAISAQRPIGSRVDTCKAALERSIAKEQQSKEARSWDGGEHDPNSDAKLA